MTEMERMALEVTSTELLDTEVRELGRHALVVLAGELDASTAGRLYERFAELARNDVNHVTVNVEGLTFIDSTGISVMVAEHKRAESMNGEMILLSPRPVVRRVIEVTGLNHYLNIRPEAARE
jgi:anti-sigma B factor antagonist